MRQGFLARRVFAPGAGEQDFEDASPLTRITAEAPDFFVLHGQKDTLVPVAQARAFVARLREVSPSTITYAELPGAQHAFEVFSSIRSQSAIKAVARWLEWHHATHHPGQPPRRPPGRPPGRPMSLPPDLLAHARAAKGFMPDDEGDLLHRLACDRLPHGPALEVGTYCGKSAIYLGAAARGGRARRGGLHRRPPPRLGGEPGRLGAPRPRLWSTPSPA